jgi:hypothetical protein
MSKPEPDHDDALWKALDAAPEVRPHPQTRARIWAMIARDEIAGTRHPVWRALFRYALPIAGVATAILAFYLGGTILIEREKTDREIAENIELYRNYEVIRDINQLASHEVSDEDIFEVIK